MDDLSKHFSREEFQDEGQAIEDVRVDERLLDGLEYLRRLLDNAVVMITKPGGGNRPNDKGSLHSQGRAADIYSPGLPLRRVVQAAEGVLAFRISGIGIYPQNNFVHVDVGRTEIFRWVRINGWYYYY